MEEVYNTYFLANKLIMSFSGMWPLQRKKYAYPLRTFAVMMFILQYIPMLVKLYTSRHNMNEIFICLPMFFSTFILYVCYYLLIGRCSKLAEILEWIAKEHLSLRNLEDQLKILQKAAYQGHLFVYFYIITTAISSTVYVGVVITPACLDIYFPIENFTRPKMYIAQVDYYFFEADDYFFYITLFSFSNAIFTIIAVTSPDLLLFTLCQHSYGMFKVFRFVDKVNYCYSPYLFVRTTVEIILISFTGAMVVIKLHETYFFLMFLSYLCILMFHLLLISIFGQQILSQSENVHNYLFDVNWYEFSQPTRKIIYMALMKSSQFSCLTIGKFGILNIETYSSLVRLIFSYLSVLITMNL